MIAQCKTCGAAIEWAVSERRHRPLPIDAEPVEDGTIVLRHVTFGEAPFAHVTSEDERDLLRRQHEARSDEPFRLYKSHFATCPQADEHRHERS